MSYTKPRDHSSTSVQSRFVSARIRNGCSHPYISFVTVMPRRSYCENDWAKQCPWGGWVFFFVCGCVRALYARDTYESDGVSRNALPVCPTLSARVCYMSHDGHCFIWGKHKLLSFKPREREIVSKGNKERGKCYVVVMVKYRYYFLLLLLRHGIIHRNMY